MGQVLRGGPQLLVDYLINKVPILCFTNISSARIVIS